MLKLRVVLGTALASMLALAPAHADSKPDRVILGYTATWRDASNPPAEYNYDGVTYLARAFLQPMPDGSVTVPDGYFNPVLEKLAHQHGVKILMSIGGGAIKSADWVSIAAQPQNLQKFLDKVSELMGTNHYDGVDIDWEQSDPTQADGDAYSTMIKAVRAKMPKSVITTALPTDNYSTRFISWPDVLANVDYINVMDYDFSGPWTGIAAHASNLFPASDYPAQPGHSADEGMLNLIKNHQLPPAKLLMGLNFWGYRFRVNHIGDAFKANADGVTDDLSYRQTLDLLETGHYQAMWDTAAAIPYLQRTGGGSVVCYENPESIHRKCEYAKNLGCAGMMIWNINADTSGSETPLMDAVVQASGGQRHTLGRPALEAEMIDLQQMLEHDSHVNPGAPADAEMPTVPADLSSINIDQLESLVAKLQWHEGVENDATWASKSSTAAH